VRFAWGLDGLRVLRGAKTVVVVDVLSSSTAVDVAVGHGAMVLPYAGRLEDVDEYAEQHVAVAAGRRGSSGWSLSPVSLLSIPSGTRLVLPSPNGSTLSAEPATISTVVTACLRDAPTVGGALREMQPPVAVIAAGERWGHADGRLRPAVEDLIGAGTVIGALGSSSCSAEARAALAVFRASESALGEWIRDCSSGRELVEAGFGADVELASDYGSGSTIPVLQRGAYVGRCTA
jgi:2-phosphosulfolactate phosphatase